MYAINLDTENRIQRATLAEFADIESILVDTLPEGDITEYKYVDGEYIHDPLPKPEPTPVEPTQLDRIEAQTLYTAMMTDTLL